MIKIIHNVSIKLQCINCTKYVTLSMHKNYTLWKILFYISSIGGSLKIKEFPISGVYSLAKEYIYDMLFSLNLSFHPFFFCLSSYPHTFHLLSNLSYKVWLVCFKVFKINITNSSFFIKISYLYIIDSDI